MIGLHYVFGKLLRIHVGYVRGAHPAHVRALLRSVELRARPAPEISHELTSPSRLD